MAVQVKCPNPDCGTKYSIADDAPARPVKCRRCGTRFTTAGGASTVSVAGVKPPASSVSTEAPPAKVGRFEVREVLGEGAFGRVFRAHDPQLDREVALKVPHPTTLANPRAVERSLREARAASRLRHPHIVPIHDAGRDGQLLYIAAAFIKGRTLEQAIEDGRLSERDAARIVRELAEALAYAHEQGIVHRDIKPANVLLDEQDRAHLADFGLAHRQDSAEKLTHDGAVIGTPAYMAPEQARGRQGEVKPASDQYSLGVVLYVLLTGRVPFSGPVALVLSMQINQEPPAPHTVRPAVPRDLETICLKAMAKEAAGRYADCGELADDLRRWLEGEPIHARRMGLGERVVRWCRRNPLVAGLTAAVAASLVLGIVVATLLATRANREKDRADEARIDADKKRDLLSIEQRKTQAALDQTQEEKRVTEGLLYAAHIHMGYQAWEEADIPQLDDLLEQSRPKRTGGSDLRGWEWHFLNRLAHPGCLVIKGHDRVFCVAFSPDGKRLATASVDQTSRVWDAQTGRELLVLKGHTRSVSTVTFSPDGERLASASVDGTARVWDAATGQHLLSLKGHTAYVGCVAFSPDGKRLATASGDGTARMWDAATGRELLTLKGNSGGVSSVAFSPDGKRLATASRDATARIWDAATGNELLALKGHTNNVSDVAFSPDGKRLATASWDQTSRVWDALTGRELLTFKGHTAYVQCMAFSPDSKRLATASYDKTARVWDVQSGRELRALYGHTAPVYGVAFSPDGKRLATASEDNTARVWDAEVSREILALKGHSGAVTGVAFSPDGKRLATASRDGTAGVWDAQTGQKLLALKGHTGAVHCVAFSPDGKRLTTGSDDKTARVWDAETGRELLTLKEHRGQVTSEAFSPDGKRLAIASGDGTARMWDAATGRELLALQGRAGIFTGMAFSSDGRHMATASLDRTARVWDAATGRELLALKGHTAPVLGVAFSPDGKRLATASYDRTARVWDAATGRELLALKGHSGAVWRVAFSPDGKRLATSSEDQTALIWEGVTDDAHVGNVFLERWLRLCGW